jgi:hypothetical protein
MDTNGTWPFGRRPEDQVATCFLAVFLDMSQNCGTACRNAFCFVYTYASATIPTKQRPYAFWGLPALAFALHGWQRGKTQDVILYAVFFYVRYGVSYRDLEEIMEERGGNVDHTTLNRWVIRYSPNNDLIRKAIIVNSLFEKGCCSLFITTLRKHEIKRITVTINHSVNSPIPPLLILAGFATMIEICQVKYLNNIIEQDHRFIKK